MQNKHKVMTFLVLSVIFFLLISTNEKNKETFVFRSVDTNVSSKEDSNADLILTMLNSHIGKAIRDNYGKPLMYDLWASNITETARKGATYNFKVTVQVIPYVGNHDLVGVDLITFEIEPEAVKVVKFNHIRSYPLPAHLYNYYKDLKL